MTRILLGYSGGAAATAAIPWLTDACGAEVVTLTLDLGQGVELTHIRERALLAGAVRAHVLDAREEFLRDCALPAVHAKAFAPGRPFAGIELSRPLIARHMVRLARMEGAEAVAHASACGSVDHMRLDAEVRSLAPGLRCVPVRCRWGLTDEEVATLARSRGILEMPAAAHGHIQSNIWGRLIHRPVTDADYRLTRTVDDAPADPALLDLELVDGIPLRANGVEMPLVEMIESIETIAGTHAVGRLTGPDGGAAESPAAVVLDAASRALASTNRANEAADSTMTGSVVLRLSRGACEVVSVRHQATPQPATASRLA